MSAYRTSRIVLFVVLSMMGRVAWAQDHYSSWLKNSEVELRQLLQFQTRQISENGSPALRALIQGTAVEVGLLGVPSPYVTSAGGRSKIFFPAEYLLLLKFIGDATVVGFSDAALAACATGYYGALRDRLNDNGKRAARGERLLPLIPPEDYARMATGTCSAFGARFPIAASERNLRDQGVRSVVLFAFLHELGHVALGHSPVPYTVSNPSASAEQRMQAFLASMRASRGQETAADVWAAETLAAVGGGHSDILNSVMVAYFLTVSGLDCYFEAGDTHPNGVRRLARLQNRFQLANEAVIGRRWPPHLSTLSSDLQRFSERAAALLGCPGN